MQMQMVGLNKVNDSDMANEADITDIADKTNRTETIGAGIISGKSYVRRGRRNAGGKANVASRRVLAFVIALCMALTLLPTVVYADDATTLAAQINGFAHGGTGTLTATASGNTVTVTGAVTGVVNQLPLDIDPGVTVIWKAEYASDADFTDDTDSVIPALIALVSGDGVFEVADGADIAAASSIGAVSAIANDSLIGGDIIISGGKVSATGDNSQTIANDAGDVKVSGAAQISVIGDDSQAIFSNTGEVEVSDAAKVSATGDNSQTIANDAGDVKVSETAQVSVIGDDSQAIFSNTGEVTVSDAAKVSAIGDDSQAIFSNTGEVTVSDAAQVSAEGEDSCAIMNAEGSGVTISDTAAVSGFNGIEAGILTITGGVVTSTGDGGYGVSITGQYGDGTLLMTGGTIEALGDPGAPDWYASAIILRDDAAAAITGGEIKATGTSGVAIAALTYSAAAYLDGVISAGDLYVDDGTGDMSVPGGTNGAIFEVGTLDVEIAWHTTDEEITLVEGDGFAEWDTTNVPAEDPKIKIVLNKPSILYVVWTPPLSPPPTLGSLTVDLTVGNGKITLAPQAVSAGYAYYYKSGSSSVAPPLLGGAIGSITGAAVYSAAKDITGANGTKIYVQVYKVETTGNTIVAFGEESATPSAGADKTISIQTISGLTRPVYNAKPVTSITATAEFVGTVTWTGKMLNNGSFAALTEYTATVHLLPKAGYTLSGVTANFFKVSQASSVTHSAGSGIITVKFPETGSAADDTAGAGDVTSPKGAFSGSSVFKQGSSGTIVYIIQKESKLLKNVKVDGNTLVKNTDYTVNSTTTTRITLLTTYLKTLTVGTHTLTVNYNDDTYSIVTFSVEAATVATPTETPEEAAKPNATGSTGTTGTTAPQNTTGSAASVFSDVNVTDWFYEYVMYAYVKGLMTGTSTSPMMFSPNETLTRGMVVTVLYRLEGSPVVSGGGTFNDVAAGQWYADPVSWASDNGIVNGYGDGNFGPNDNITREQTATILYNYCKFKGIDVSVGEDTNILSYEDAFSISEYAIPAFQWACGAGVIGGKPGGYLDPSGNTTRAEFATMLMRFLEPNAG